jgi:pimeloyl-ACP methyl ester carboxylesterase
MEELVYARSADGAELAGVVFRPPSVAARPDAVLWLHGAWDSFYKPTLVHVSRELAELGYVSVAGNDSGHDLATALRKGGQEPVLGGHWWEQLETSPDDVALWMDFVEGLGFERIVLAGHSLGAAKALYYQAQRHDARLLGLVVASPPSPATCEDAFGSTETVALARQMVAQGRGRDLLPWGSVPVSRGTASAQTYLSLSSIASLVYGPDGAVAQIRCPLLAFYGTEEPHVGTAADLEAMRQSARAASSVETALIEGADHLYTGHEAQAAAIIAGWIGKLA